MVLPMQLVFLLMVVVIAAGVVVALKKSGVGTNVAASRTGWVPILVSAVSVISSLTALFMLVVTDQGEDATFFWA